MLLVWFVFGIEALIAFIPLLRKVPHVGFTLMFTKSFIL
ncbi:hypothetical protein RINTHH_10190 [Richelia intracellularis HH01]|uniref:Uncharacterized protein n=1 Tax=Richelia intracellularis HH01 TaxID=1165094 RepID=M1WS02_9NOST|nr:hypothetical protein RINTHH_10190 [Richelia intracellularis HH01]